MSDDERAIRDLVDTWMSATKAGDLRTVLSLMADDVICKEAFAEATFRNYRCFATGLTFAITLT
jgi:ketosteroid isomerase-like protein